MLAPSSLCRRTAPTQPDAFPYMLFADFNQRRNPRHLSMRGFQWAATLMKTDRNSLLSFWVFCRRSFCRRGCCCSAVATAFVLLGPQPRCLAAWGDAHPAFGQMRLPPGSSRLQPPLLFVSSRTSNFLSSSCFFSAHGRESKRCAALNRARTMPERFIASIPGSALIKTRKTAH